MPIKQLTQAHIDALHNVDEQKLKKRWDELYEMLSAEMLRRYEESGGGGEGFFDMLFGPALDECCFDETLVEMYYYKQKYGDNAFIAFFSDEYNVNPRIFEILDVKQEPGPGM